MAEARQHVVPDEPDGEQGEGKMGFLEHLDELRKRIIRSCVAIAAGMLVAFFFVDRLGDFILAPTLKTLPPGEDTFDLYKNMMIGMVIVFQMPTLIFFLAKMRLVTARFLWRNIKYAILIIFVLAAALTPSTDPWNQTIFAAPMIGLYLAGIVIAWIVGPKQDKPNQQDAPKLRRGFAAT